MSRVPVAEQVTHVRRLKPHPKMSMQMRYLQYYFFREFEGLGCPKKFSQEGKDYCKTRRGMASQTASR